MGTNAFELLKAKISEKDYMKLLKIENPSLQEFIAEYVTLLNPASVYVCDDSDEDNEYIKAKSIEMGEEKPLALDGHTVHFNAYGDQGRDRKNTRILLKEGEDLGELIDTGDRETYLRDVKNIMTNVMAGKELIIRFFCLGPVESEFAIPCVQLTDSYSVSHGESLLYRRGYEEMVRQSREANGDEAKLNRYFKFVHSAGEIDPVTKVSINLDKRRMIIDRDDSIVFSINTQYEGNAFGLKKLAMRLAIALGEKEGWLNEHMFILGVHGPDAKETDTYKDENGKRVTYIVGAFPSICGKTSTAMMEGETIVGDDLAYLRIKENGTVKVANAEKGIFGVIQGLNSNDDPAIYKTITTGGSEIMFSNVLWLEDGSVHWAGKDGEVPAKGYNHSGEWFKGKTDATGKEIPCSHPNARFTLSLDQLKNVDPNLNNPEGVDVSGFVFGGRDSDTWATIEQAKDYEEGIILKGASVESETTAATLGAEGVREFNPMASLDFLSIPIGRYVDMHLKFGERIENAGGVPPVIFSVNYYLKDASGNFLTDVNDKKVWYKWMELRTNGDVDAIETPSGFVPKYEDLQRLFKEVLNKDFSYEVYNELFKLRIPENLKKIERLEKIYREQVKDTPQRVFEVFANLKARLLKAQLEMGDYIEPEKFLNA